MIGRAYHCDAPDCEVHTGAILSYPPTGWITVSNPPERRQHFCTWDCVMKFAATLEPAEIIHWDRSGEEGTDG